ncbi:MAG: tRNA uridine-5-carboxymethylaminomethyl(34) synthesis GTPase MnmE [Opitutae bacterium]|nr:tRNA uridine-5-carboxymethylaminomethyl(34) synthesis GTPase MnmE [Opitutae bacterium]
MPRPTELIAALGTPAGTAALAVLRVSGADTARLVRELWGELPPARRARRADYRDAGGTLVDDVLYTFFAGPNSYTGEDALEISCHGNPFIAQKILEDLFNRGCRPAEPGEFTQRAFLNGRMDLSQAEAVMDLIHARSERALAAAHQQLRGALGRKMEALIERLLGVLAQVEAYIDFPDEDLPAENRAAVLAAVQAILRETEQLLATSHYGEMLREGIKTVIVGEPNVGKSSLLNRLIGRDRALVSPEPGTTRDFIEERLLVGGHGLRLIDTAGLNRNAPQALEKLGMEKTGEQVEAADLFLWVLDATALNELNTKRLSERMAPDNTVVVLNKCDLAPISEMKSMPAPLAGLPVVQVSAQTGAGISALLTEIEKLADGFQRQQGGELIVINARHAHALTSAQTCLRAAIARLSRADRAVELLASELRGALEALGEISGRVDNERMLDHLFASFCIGK